METPEQREEPYQEEVVFSPEQLEAMREGHFGLVPAVEQLLAAKGVLNLRYQEVGSGIRWEMIEGSTGAKIKPEHQFGLIEQGDGGFVFVVITGDKTFPVAQLERLEGQGLPELTRFHSQGSELMEAKPQKESLPHENQWNLVDPETPVTIEMGEGDRIGFFEINLGTSQLDSHKEDGALPEMMLVEIAAQNIAAILLKQGEVPTFQGIEFIFHKGFEDYDLEALEKIAVQFRTKQEGRRGVVVEMLFGNTEDNEVLFSAKFIAKIIPRKLFDRMMQ